MLLPQKEASPKRHLGGTGRSVLGQKGAEEPVEWGRVGPAGPMCYFWGLSSRFPRGLGTADGWVSGQLHSYLVMAFGPLLGRA